MASKYLPLQLNDDATHLFELIREEYKRNSRIERLMDPTKSFPIEESYINLSIVESKEEREKEKNLRDAKHNDMIMDSFENIYGTKTPIDIKDIFKNCKDYNEFIKAIYPDGIQECEKHQPDITKIREVIEKIK